mgnify:CR=1
MFKQLNTQYVINFEPNSNVKDYLDQIQRELSRYFSKDAFNVIGIPDNAKIPPEVPRILATSPKGHSLIQVSGSAINLQTTFDGTFSGDFSVCRKYIFERIYAINKIAKLISEDKVLFCGIISVFNDNDVKNAAKFIRDSFFVEKDSDIFDIIARFTFVEDTKYYKNIAISNARKSLQEESLSVSVDVNNRYMFNYDKGKYTTDEDFEKLLKIYDNFVNEKLELVKEGRV